ncbi:MAG: response regulator [Planctomycetota bacterium]
MARVLIIEDHPALASVLHFNLRAAGYEPSIATDGREALTKCLSEEPFDLILLDHQLPGMLGLEVCATLRQAAAYRDVPVVMLTAKQHEFDPDQLDAEYGICNVYGKPFSPSEVIHWVTNFLDSREGRVDALAP